VTDQGYKTTETARNLDIHSNILRKWKDQLTSNSDQTFPGRGHENRKKSNCTIWEEKISNCTWNLKS